MHVVIPIFKSFILVWCAQSIVVGKNGLAEVMLLGMQLSGLERKVTDQQKRLGAWIQKLKIFKTKKGFAYKKSE